ncbi:hypothetical protein AB0G79_13225 [Streptomyces sp. NPDC020807]
MIRTFALALGALSLLALGLTAAANVTGGAQHVSAHTIVPE